MQVVDAVIIGGGPAGAAAAILLAEAGWSVVVIEQKIFPRRKVCGEYLSATNWPLLTRLGVKEAFDACAGPPVTSTAILAGNASYPAPLPAPTRGQAWGRALSRERLDTLLLARAASLGALVLQPARCLKLEPSDRMQIVTVQTGDHSTRHEIRAPVVIAAHGSWEKGGLPTDVQQQRPHGSDWLAFKAHFRESGLPEGLMPLICFPDGYGGMVHCEGGRVSLSFCIRRRRLKGLDRAGGVAAGEVALMHLRESCRAVRNILEGAIREGPWLSAGVIRPGIRPRWVAGAFVVGNAAGEAHPVVAEGISMALQGAWLLAEALRPHRAELNAVGIRARIARDYSRAWRAAFAPRIRAAAAISQWASRPLAVRSLGPLLTLFPGMVTFGARLSGKSRIVSPEVHIATNTECSHA